MEGKKMHSEREPKKLSVIGLGYIGLPTAAMFASTGMEVVGVDVSQRAVESINAGKPHIEEGDLDVLVEKCVAEGKLRAQLTPESADAFIIAVPTPVGHDDQHRPDLSYVRAAGESIAPVLKKGDLVILESTSPVGTTEMLARLMQKARPDLTFAGLHGGPADVGVAYCPERIIPGRMLKELVENERIVGGLDEESSLRAARLYKKFVKSEVHASTARVAEMVKLTENSFRDVNIAFANELSMICDELDVDVWDVIRFANRHPRVSILQPGAGVGGHCIAVDPWFVVDSAPETSRIVRMARIVNDLKPEFVMDKIMKMAADGKAKVGCLGLSYKPDVDDFRESPALEIAQQLSARMPGRVLCTDPFGDVLAMQQAMPEEFALRSVEDVLGEVDIVVILVGHSAYRTVSFPENVRLLDVVGFWRN